MSTAKTMEGEAHVKNGIVRMIFAVLSMVVNVIIVVLIAFYMRNVWAWFHTRPTCIPTRSGRWNATNLSR